MSNIIWSAKIYSELFIVKQAFKWISDLVVNTVSADGLALLVAKAPVGTEMTPKFCLIHVYEWPAAMK